MAMLVVLTLVLSAVVILKVGFDIELVKPAEAIKGVSEFGYPTNTTTQGLTYDPDTAVDIPINTTGLTASTTYYLYYPNYYSSGSTYNLTWKRYSTGAAITVSSPGVDETLEDIYLNRTGMWVVSSVSYSTYSWDSINGSSWSNIDKWFWVNTSSTDSITVSPGEVYYGDNTTLTVNIKNSAGDLSSSWIDMRKNYTAETTQPEISGFPKYTATGVSTFSSSYLTTLVWAGNYSIYGYRTAVYTPDYQGIGYGYNNSFGNANYTHFTSLNSSSVLYDYQDCGPWNPPAYNTSKKNYRVYTGVPTTTVPAANSTMYWSFDGQVNISVKQYDGENLSCGLDVKVFNSDDEVVTSNVTVYTGQLARGWIWINSTSWGKDSNDYVWGENGTYYAYLYNDSSAVAGQADEYTEKWNGTVEWQVGDAPGVQLKWINDGGGTLNDGVIPAVPAIGSQPLNIQFQLISSTHSYYGDTAWWNAADNITLTGDALFTGKLNEIPGVSYSSHTWTVPTIPLMNTNGGEITISATWPDVGSVSDKLSIGGSDLNGTIVTISPTTFPIDQNVTITVTVTSPNGYPDPYANVGLYWVNGSNLTSAGKLDGAHRINYTGGGGTTTGQYVFHFNTTQQTTNQTAYGPYSSIKAPRNISAYVQQSVGGGNYNYGYAKAVMKPQSDLKVAITKDTIMAGQKTAFWANISIVDSSGNTTGYPKVDGSNPIQIALYNSTGDRVTLDSTFGSIRNSDLDAINNSVNEYFLVPGVYTVYVYNNTHDSTGNNVTLTVKAADVTCDKGEFIWKVDNNITAVFTVKYNGELMNGTLELRNITQSTDYNKTWVNYSNSSSYRVRLTVTNGVATINNVTANFLEGEKAFQNITCWFKPSTSGSDYAIANGVVPVTVATVTPSPSALAFDQAAKLEIMVTGHGSGLANVLINITIPGLSGTMGSRSDANGKVTFAFTPPTTGTISIAVENRTTDTTIPVTSWALYIENDAQVDEQTSFTVTVRNNSATGEILTGAAVTFNGVTKTSDYTFTAPEVKSDETFTIRATKDGYADDTSTVKVINVAKLVIVPSATEVSTGQEFDVTIADDSGNSIIGATVTFEGKTYTSGSMGKVTLTAPSKAGTGEVTATKTNFRDADAVVITIKEGGVPGFELLTLIAAIGVAFILIRRRKQQ